MRRENRRKQNDKTKTILYGVGSLIAIAILAFIAIFVLYGDGASSNESSQFSTAKVNNLVPNSNITNSMTEQASSSIGKSVNEAKNTVNTSNTNTSNKTSKSSTNTSNSSSAIVPTKVDNKNTVETANKAQKSEETKKTEETVAENKETQKTENETTAAKQEQKDPVFVKPVEGEILREYAKDKLVYSETLKEWITHPGVDIKAEKASVVKAAADGRVASIKNDPRYGLTVVVEHSNGFKTVYSNLLTAEFVTEGEEITSGQTIGTIGNTATFEVLDSDHLHFEILKDNVNVDPTIYIQM